MRYFSFDIETTGLDPSTDQILEIGIVEDDLTQQLPLTALRRFHTYILHERIFGHPIALSMNSLTLECIGRRISGLKSEEVASEIAKWVGGDKIVAAGKNFGAFDLQFLKKLPGWNIGIHHRYLDPAPYYLTQKDKMLPSLQECSDRAGIKAKVAHNAIDDALLVIELYRHAWNNLP